MMKMKRLLALAMAFVLGASLLSGCGGGGGSSSGSGDGSGASSSGTETETVEPMDLSAVTDPYLATAGVAGDTVVATAGGHEILAADYLYWLERAAASYLSQLSTYYGVTEIPWDMETENGTMKDMVQQTALETAALFRLMPEIGTAEGISLSQESQDTVQAQLEALGDTEQERDYVLWYQMMTQDLYARVYEQLEMYSQLQELYYGEDSEDYPTDAEVLAYAEEDMGVYRAKHILIMTVDEETREPLADDVIAEKKAQADDLLAQIRAASDPVAKFDELMNEYSEDPGLATNPDGYVAVQGQMVPEFEEAALALEPGEISDVVYSESTGYHIILRLPLDPADYRSDMIIGLMEDRTKQWLADNPVETTETFDQIDPQAYEAKVRSLQAGISQVLNADQETQSADGSQS